MKRDDSLSTTDERPDRARWASLFVLQFGPIPIDVPNVPDVGGMIESGVKWVIKNLWVGVLEALTKLFTVGFETFLFYSNPADVPVLNELWWTSFGAFTLIAGLAFLYKLLLAMLFPSTTGTGDIHYFTERVAKYFIVIFISRELIAFFVSFTHVLAGLFYQGSFDLTIGPTIALNLIEEVNMYVGLSIGAVVVPILILAGSGFVIILICRMFVVYLTYALLPLFMGFQLVRVGPWNVINDLGKKFLDATAKLMLFGMVVTALLWASVAVGDFSDYDDDTRGVVATDGDAIETEPDATFASIPFDIVRQFIMFVTPLLMINYLGFQMLMQLL